MFASLMISAYFAISAFSNAEKSGAANPYGVIFHFTIPAEAEAVPARSARSRSPRARNCCHRPAARRSRARSAAFFVEHDGKCSLQGKMNFDLRRDVEGAIHRAH